MNYRVANNHNRQTGQSNKQEYSLMPSNRSIRTNLLKSKAYSNASTRSTIWSNLKGIWSLRSTGTSTNKIKNRKSNLKRKVRFQREKSAYRKAQCRQLIQGWTQMSQIQSSRTLMRTCRPRRTSSRVLTRLSVRWLSRSTSGNWYNRVDSMRVQSKFRSHMPAKHWAKALCRSQQSLPKQLHRIGSSRTFDSMLRMIRAVLAAHRI